jgi:hypothetical protein
MAVTIGIIDPGYRWPELVLSHPGGGKRGLFSTIGVGPGVGGNDVNGMGSVLEHVVAQ